MGAGVQCGRSGPGATGFRVTLFRRYLGIDYSGAEAPDSSLKGIRVYLAEAAEAPREVPPPSGPKRYWTRRGLAEWLVTELWDAPPTLIGLDHGFSFPLRYFETHRLPPDWPAFLDDFQRHWPTDAEHTYVDFIREGLVGQGAARSGNARWRRLCEERTPRAKSVFHFDVPGSVAKSTHAGLPWLRVLRHRLGSRLHFWPFDGWSPPRAVSLIAEVYPALWSGPHPREGRTPDQHDAWCVAASLRDADRARRLGGWLAGPADSADRAVAMVEGWILGVESPSE